MTKMMAFYTKPSQCRDLKRRPSVCRIFFGFNVRLARGKIISIIVSNIMISPTFPNLYLLGWTSEIFTNKVE